MIQLARLVDPFWRLHARRGIFTNIDVAYLRGQMLMRLTYVVWFMYTMAFLRNAEAMAMPEERTLLWPVDWLQYVDFDTAAYGMLGAGLLSTLLAAVFPNVLLLRVAAFVSVFLFQATRYSYGKIDHSSHPWVFAAFLLIFIPREKLQDSTHRRAFLEVIWGVQAVTLACYTLAGIQKLWGAWLDWSTGGLTVFHPTGLSVQVARFELTGQGGGLLADAMIDYPILGYPLMLGTIYLELFSILVAFRPRIHKLWGAGLMAMHAGIALSMNIFFDPMVLMVGAWLLLSPFAPSTATVAETLRDLPVLGLLFRVRGFSRRHAELG